MPEIAWLTAQLREESGLPELLSTGFDVFEVVRELARSCDSAVPQLFATFMMAADAAVDGREAITVAPALRPGGPPGDTGVPSAGAGVHQITAGLAALAALLAERLAGAATLARSPGDRRACAQAAAAARRIHDLMGP
jgi:hypothetical protein